MLKEKALNIGLSSEKINNIKQKLAHEYNQTYNAYIKAGKYLLEE